MRQRLQRFYRAFGFLIVPMVNALSPLLVLPAITANFGSSAWAAVAISQSLAAAGAALIELGWPLTGPQRVARQSVKNRRAFFVLVMGTKLLTAVPVILVLAPVAYFLVPAYQIEAAILTAFGCLASLANAWFFIGAGKPGSIILADSLPRLVPLITCALLLSLGWPFVTFVWATGIGAILVPLMGVLLVGARAEALGLLSWSTMKRAVMAQGTAVTGRMLSATYIALPITLVSLVNPAAVPIFAAAERLQRMALMALQAFPNMMLGWVGGGKNRDVRISRAARAILMNAVVGSVAGTAFALGAPLASDIIFSGVAPVSHTLGALCGMLIFIVSVSRGTGNIMLVVLRRIDVVATSALVGCLVGVPAILGLAYLYGPMGGLLGEIIGEIAVLSVQLRVVLRARR